VRINGRLVLVGDGIKAPKRGKKMPAVKLAAVHGGDQMDDHELWISQREALNYIATESDQAHEAVLAGDSGKSGSDNEKFESDVVEADLVTWGTSKPPEQARFSGPPAPHQIHLSLLGAATEAFKEGARRGIRCRGTHPVTRERVDIEFGDWPVLIIPVEAAFNDKGEVLKEENGVPILFCEGMTVYWPDLARQFPRPSIEKTAPLPAPPAGAAELLPKSGAEDAAETEATRWQREPVIALIKKYWPPHGIRPNGVTIAMVTNRLNNEPEFKSKSVSEDTVGRAFRDIKAAREK
jgi:hypothetical protein